METGCEMAFESGIVGNLGNNRDYRGGGGHKIYKARHFLLCFYSRLIPMKLSIKNLCGAHLLLRRTFPRFPKRIPILPTQKFYF